MSQSLQRCNGPLPAGEGQRKLVERLESRYHVRRDPAQQATAQDDKQELTRTVANAAKLLSNELYTKDDHSILELVQNADDCLYNPNVQPSFQIILLDNGLLVATNERGFVEANVNAICNLGSSSKSRSLGAYTGEKGIGFKAVALISQATYIDSGGFKFVFDTRPESYLHDPELRWLGLVRPRWEEDLSSKMEQWITQSLADVDGIDADGLLSELDGYGTCMYLELKPECDRHRLAQQLANISPFMLLNLRQLRHMRVLIATQDSTQDRTLTYAEHDGVVTLTEQEGPWRGNMQQRQHHLFRLKRTIEVPADVEQSEEKRQGVKQVALMFALPMEDNGITASPDPQAQVFAFLPVGPYGFRFNIQADFVLPSSREGILDGRLWNQWIRDQLAPAFVGEALKALAAGSLSCAALLQFLPLPDDVPDTFLGPAASSMLQLLRDEACVLTASGGYSKPSGVLLPDALLELPNGQQLISNEWLDLGLPGCQYTHPDLLADASSSSSSRACSVLVELGAGHFSAELLIQWLTAPNTLAHLTTELPEPECSKWLEGLYACLHRLTAQPVSCPLSLADAQEWGGRLATAPIVPLHGAARPVTYDSCEGSSQSRVFLWDTAFGSAADVDLFSSSSTDSSSGSNSSSPVLFVDPVFCTQQTKTESVLVHFFGVSKVPMDALVDAVLAQQDSRQLDHTRRQQQLLFLVRNRQHLGDKAWRKLQAGLQLRAAPAAAAAHTSAAAGAPAPYKVAVELHFPCAIAGPVPAALQQDLMTVGVQFLHPDLEQLLVGGGQGVSPSDVHSFLQTLGVRELSAHDAVNGLLQLYKSTDSLVSMRADQHLRHVSFMASPAAATAVSGLKEAIRTGLRLYREQQQPDSEGPSVTPKQLFLPLSNGSSCADSVMLQLRKTGTQFIHGCYLSTSFAAGVSAEAAVATSEIQQFLSAVAGLKTGPNAVVRELLKLHIFCSMHEAGITVRRAAEMSGLQLGDMLLHQLQYIAAHRTHLSTAVQQLCRSELWLLSSDGFLRQPRSSVQLPPDAADTLQILQELSSLGGNVQVLDACYAPIWSNAESKLVLTELLGLSQADAATAIHSMVDVHSKPTADGSPVSGQQLLMHLQYLAQHKHLLEGDADLCKQVQQAVALQDSEGNPAAATELFFPLDADFAQGLQEDMQAAGMRTLHSSFAAERAAAAAEQGSSSDSQHSAVSAQQWTQLLHLLGVKTAGVEVIAQHISQLYSGSQGQAGVTEQQRMSHLGFFADNIKFLEDTRSGLLQQVREGLQLQDSSGVYRAPCELHHALESKLAILEPDMLAAGMHFLHSSYTAAAASDTQAALSKLHTLLELLGVSKATHDVVAEHLLQLYKAGEGSASAVQEDHLRHLTFFAENMTLLQDNSSLLQQVQQHVLLLDSTEFRRTAADLYFSLGADAADHDLQADVMGAGMHFIHRMYTAAGRRSAFKQLFRLLEVKKPDKVAIIHYIVQLHAACGTEPSSITEEQRCRHLAFLAAHSEVLEQDSSLLDQAKGAVHLQDSSGAYKPAKHLWFPPEGEAADLQPDLAAAGMRFIHERYMVLLSKHSSSKQRQVMQLLELLRVDHPSERHIAEYLIYLHDADSRAVSEQQRCSHLAYWADNKRHLEGKPSLLGRLKDKPSLLAMLQESLTLQDSSGSYRPAGELVFPLGPEASILQPSMDAAGMHFLHSSYTEAASASTGSSSKPSRMLLPLLYDLGVSDPDAVKIAACILTLFQPSTAAASSNGTAHPVSFDQHMAHIQFLFRSWSQLQPSVQEDVHKQLQVRLLGCGSCTASASEATGDSQSVYLLPPGGSTELQMLPTLQSGGALFLAADYSAAATGLQGGAVWRELEQWFVKALGVRRLSHEDAAGFILTAHSSSSYKLDAVCSQQDVIMQGLYVAAVSHRLSNSVDRDAAKALQKQAKQHLQILVHPDAPQSSSSSNSMPDDVAAADDSGTAVRNYRCQTATQGVMYWPASGGHHSSSSWQLQEVLLPSEVAYLHPGYISALQQWNQDSGGLLHLTTSGLQRFFTQALGMQVMPVPSSASLQAAITAGYRWRPLLLMLREVWSTYRKEEQEVLRQQLQDMMVEASCGPRPLHQCFVPTQALPANFVALLTQLQLPVLELPAQCDWSFLQQLGVSTELNWPTLHKALQQLSGGGMLTGSDDDLAAMGCLYEVRSQHKSC